LYDVNWKPIWASNTNNNSGAFLSLQTNGDLVVYNSNASRALWATNTVQRPTPVQPTTSSRATPPLSSLEVSNSKCYFGGVCDGTAGKHNGIDYKAAVGTEVKAICDGVVVQDRARTESTTPDVRNRFTIIKHTNCSGYPVLYGYYGHINASVVSNQSVKQGQVIGKVATYIVNYVDKYGKTQSYNNNHLHFSVSTQDNLRGWGYGVDKGGWFDPTSLFR
jgi:murein DD-endopeptidase MepM/ murein hydrolase activator NlpD